MAAGDIEQRWLPDLMIINFDTQARALGIYAQHRLDGVWHPRRVGILTAPRREIPRTRVQFVC